MKKYKREIILEDGTEIKEIDKNKISILYGPIVNCIKTGWDEYYNCDFDSAVEYCNKKIEMIMEGFKQDQEDNNE